MSYVSNNTNLRDTDIVVDIRTTTMKVPAFNLLYTGSLSLRLASIIQDHLWFKCLMTANLTSTMRQDLYNMARNGIIPVVICVPNNTTDLEYYGERYAATIAGAIKTFTVLLSQSAFGHPADSLYDEDDDLGGEPA